MFWLKLGVFIVRSLNEGFVKGELSTTQNEGVVICIPKGDQPREFIKNWRPITLLNVVYKIGSSCIANRLKLVLSSLINEDQTGFIPNRFLGDNLRLLYDVISYVNEENMSAMLLCLDFEKAFDSIDWGFMHKVLSFFGFGPDFCRWVNTFQHNIKATVSVNGQISTWFPIERGCRQGDPISPYLFILCVEILGIMIRENSNIRGIIIGEVEHKISQFADDTEMTLHGDRQSFEEAMQVLDHFGSKSGLFLNAHKTSAIWLGNMRNSPVKFMHHLNIKWNPQRFKILGIWFTNDLKDCAVINMNFFLAKFRLCIGHG